MVVKVVLYLEIVVPVQVVVKVLSEVMVLAPMVVMVVQVEVRQSFQHLYLITVVSVKLVVEQYILQAVVVAEVAVLLH